VSCKADVSGTHPIHRRLLAEDPIRLRRSDEHYPYAAAQRRGRIDPNPHQIDAVVFALRRIPEGGCILADEVGLGKTIEAGLVIAQLLAEGRSNKEVAKILGIGVRTAETHRNNIMRKLDCQSLSDLVRYAIRNNLVVP